MVDTSISTGRAAVRPALPRARYPRGAAAPVLAEVRRGPFVESRHRGHIVQVDVTGKVERGVGDPDYVTSLRSAVKPFGVTALLEAGGADQFHLTDQEIAVMSASHHGEDAHVRTIQAMLRRAGLSQSLLACGSDGAPADTLTAAQTGARGRGARADSAQLLGLPYLEPAPVPTGGMEPARLLASGASQPGGGCRRRCPTLQGETDRSCHVPSTTVAC